MLYICGTPIGNLEDISPRLINTLKEVDFILCEDTRHSIKLLNHLNISKKLISYNKDNELKKADDLITLLLENKKIALISDAGMPIISDPGYFLVKKAIENNINIIPISGPTAFTLALVASGFEIDTFIFYGFIDRDKNKREKFFEDIKQQNKVIVFYESPHKLLNTLKELLEKIADLEICLARELTKKYEEFWRGNVSEAINYFSEKEIKGEFCIVLNAYKKEEESGETQDINDFISNILSKDIPTKDASKIIAEKFNISSKEAYKMIINFKNI
ncbi:MAG: 16S rRNA (cytidine(1402)-2'-O)-methyltransferase [Candidatus Sericytochromatia bacterium]